MALTVKHHAGEYQVHWGQWADVAPHLPENAILITDSNVEPLLPPNLAHQPRLVFPAGEGSKTWTMAGQLHERLAQMGALRATTIVAVGGGVTGDLAGFVAASYMRGVPLIQVPTSLLAMVDSSVGGKVGVDLAAGKNLAGAFWPPQAVIVPFDALTTLPGRELRAGMAEVIKAAWIARPELIETLRTPVLNAQDPRLPEIIQDSIAIKAQVVEADEFERIGIRATLNFGHTIGHALESLTNYETYVHGEAVSIGMVAEARISANLGLIPQEAVQDLIQMCQAHGLPTALPPGVTTDDLLPYMRKDKKAEGTHLALALLHGYGACKLHKDVAPDVVRQALQA
ncbi:MAG: 3-dehydroquinate synthase [Fimbriimonadaceae bacterium]